MTLVKRFVLFLFCFFFSEKCFFLIGNYLISEVPEGQKAKAFGDIQIVLTESNSILVCV